jgi:phage-related protein
MTPTRLGWLGGPRRYKARFYATPSGRKIVRKWLLDLADDDRRLIGKDIQKVEFGWPIGMPYCHSLGHGLWEMRSDLTGGRISRVVFIIVAEELVLPHGFVKKTQKTPRQDIELALRRKRELD